LHDKSDVMPAVRFVLLFCLASAAAPAQAADATQLVEQLAHAATRGDARERLVALGASAALPLATRIDTACADHARACLEVLGELGPAGGTAVPKLVEVLRDRTRSAGIPVDVRVALVATLAELIPYRGDGIEITVVDQGTFNLLGLRRVNGVDAMDTHWTRLMERQRFPRGLHLDTLLVAASGRRALDVEVAIEQIGARGPAASRAVPLLRAVLDRPEPRLLPTDVRVPLHRKAAQALLAIAPDAPQSAAARAVLAGTWSPPAAPEPAVPERARRRVDELLEQLGSTDRARRQVAADNLAALGAIAAGPVATRLGPSASAETIDAALDVLRRLGKHAAPAVPAIDEALTRLPADHTIAAVRALGATLPWSTETFLDPKCSFGVGHLVIRGRRIAGTIDVEFVNTLQAALTEMEAAMTVPVDGLPEQLRVLLSDASVTRRRRTLEVIAARGTECASLLDTLAGMLAAPQPAEVVTEKVDEQSSRTTQVDRSDVIQRLAARAILAVAPADHALLAAARERLARPVAK
jgi:hypothetical protein